MGGTGVIDRFLGIFSTYIDSGFGLLSGNVAFLATTLIVLDMTLAALFWAWGSDNDVIARLVKKTLFVGVFAYIIGNWNTLARIIFNSFAGLGLKASGTAFTTAELLQPGRIAQAGMDSARPLLTAISDLMGFVSFFENFLQIVILLVAWGIVILAFFILAIQLFITLIEFKLVTLCGFVLIPLGLFGKTAFLAERVLGNVFSSGIKVLVLAVIVGIGSTIFAEFTAAIGAEPTIEDALSIVLASLSLLGLGIFGPGIAGGIIAGGPQLGAGSAAGTALLAGGAAAAGVAGSRLAGGAVASAASGIAHGTARAAGGATSAFAQGSAGKSGAAAVGAGLAAVGGSAAQAATTPLRRAGDALRQSYRDGAASSAVTPTASGESGPPAWAKAMKNRQSAAHGASLAAHMLKAGDSHGSGATISLDEKDR